MACGMNLVSDSRRNTRIVSREDEAPMHADKGVGSKRTAKQLRACGVVALLAMLVALGCRDRTRPAAGTIAGASTAPRSSTTAVTPPPAAKPVPGPKPPARVATVPPKQVTPTPTTPPRDSAAIRSESTTTKTITGSTTTAPAVAPAPPAPPAPSALSIALARLPFQNKERLEYQVKYGFLGVGSAVLEVLGMDSVRGAPAVHATFTVKGGVRIYRVNDSYESWFDPASFATLRAVQNIDEGSYDRQRDYAFFGDRKMMSENGKPETPTVADPLDEASFLFFLRSIPLEVGKTYEFERYFRPDKNPVRVIVERKEPVKVPAGQFQTIVVRPVIKTSGIFGEGGRAEVWFTDDSTRTLVQLKSQLKFGSLNLYLRNRRAGTPWEGAATVAGPAR
jgi:hypothetical protein